MDYHNKKKFAKKKAKQLKLLRSLVIISGGQTGADQGGLRAAGRLNLNTGGYAPKGWMTEDGPAEWLNGFGLMVSNDFSYRERTKQNVKGSDLTLLFGNVKSPGSKLTAKYAKQLGVSLLVNPTVKELSKYLQKNKLRVINVAGSRESVSPGIKDRVTDLVYESIRDAWRAMGNPW